VIDDLVWDFDGSAATRLLSLTVLLCGLECVAICAVGRSNQPGPSPTNPAGALQEVAPPLAVQQVQALLGLSGNRRLKDSSSPANRRDASPAAPGSGVEIDDWPLVGPGPSDRPPPRGSADQTGTPAAE